MFLGETGVDWDEWEEDFDSEMSPDEARDNLQGMGHELSKASKNNLAKAAMNVLLKENLEREREK